MNVARTLKDAYNLSNPVQPLPRPEARATAGASSSENAEEVFGIALSLYEAIGGQYSLARGLFYYAQFLASQGQRESHRRPGTMPRQVPGYQLDRPRHRRPTSHP